MKHKPDWADEKARHIYHVVTDNFVQETQQKIIERIAFDLRKAKADGMREASNLCSEDSCPKVYHLHTADKIEKGQA